MNSIGIKLKADIKCVAYNKGIERDAGIAVVLFQSRRLCSRAPHARRCRRAARVGNGGARLPLFSSLLALPSVSWVVIVTIHNKTASRADSRGANKSLKRSALRLHCPLRGPQARAAAQLRIRRTA
jgi:hypothetical protein